MRSPLRGPLGTPVMGRSAHRTPEEGLRRVSLACAFLAGGLGILALLAGVVGPLTSLGQTAVPVAPSRALMFILFSAAVISAVAALIARASGGVSDRAESAHQESARQSETETRARDVEFARLVADQTTRLAELERRIKEATDEADRVTRSKGDFLSRMGHELRTPLNALLGFAQLLEMDSLPPEQRERVEQILNAGTNLLAIINETLDFARIESGRLSLSPKAVSVGDMMRRTLDAVGSLAAESRVHVQAGDVDALTQHVRADPDRLTQVLQTLLSNAIRFNRQGGIVTLAFAERQGRRFRIQVSDTGGGIPAETLEKLFVPFERVSAEPTGVSGAGLALALSRRLIEAMGGAMGAESTVGRGSTFWIELPLADAPVERMKTEESVPSAAKPPQPKDHYTALYIEDNLSNLKLVENIITRRPHITLISALQGRLGLELARQHRPDLILLDLHLPDIRGDEVLHRLRQNPESRHIPVVVISADALPGQISRLLDAGARAYLTKPIDVAKLLALVDDILNSGGSADAPAAPSGAATG